MFGAVYDTERKEAPISPQFSLLSFSTRNSYRNNCASSPSLLKRVSSVGFPSEKVTLPANIINVFPKSKREGTIQIFKAKIKENREFDKHETEQSKPKAGPSHHEIKKKDLMPLVDVLVEKARKDYKRKKEKNLAGSMFVNDLWAKKYEVNVKRQARIDTEIEKEENFKRKPVTIRMKKAMEFFEQNFNPCKKIENKPDYFSPRKKKHFKMFTEMTETETDFRAETLETEPDTDAGERTRRDEKDYDSRHHFPQLSTMQSLPLAKGKDRRSLALTHTFSDFERRTTTAIDMDSLKLSLTTSRSQRAIFFVNAAQQMKHKNELNEKKDELNKIINLCEAEVSTKTQWDNYLKDFNLEDITGRKKRNLIGMRNEKRLKLLEECKSSLEKRTYRK